MIQNKNHSDTTTFTTYLYSHNPKYNVIEKYKISVSLDTCQNISNFEKKKSLEQGLVFSGKKE